MSLLIEVNCSLQSHREVLPSAHGRIWTQVPDFQYLVCFETCLLMDCIRSADSLNVCLVCSWVGMQYYVDFEIALWDGNCSFFFSAPALQILHRMGGMVGEGLLSRCQKWKEAAGVTAANP